MKYLLDTHVLLWWLEEPKKLSKKAQTIIQNRALSIYVSSVSFWELAIKNSLGRIICQEIFCKFWKVKILLFFQLIQKKH